jgi:hypothetical protein
MNFDTIADTMTFEEMIRKSMDVHEHYLHGRAFMIASAPG